MQVMVYFKKLNAFMNSWANKKEYRIDGVPAGEEVWLIAFGKKDDQVYYGQQPYTIAGNGQVSLQLSKVDDEKIMERIRGLK